MWLLRWTRLAGRSATRRRYEWTMAVEAQLCEAQFISRDMDLWAYQRGVILDFSRPGKPTDNAFIEAFNSKLRSECLNAHWFLSLQDACKKLEAWRRHYNEERPHSAIGNIPPIMLANSAGATSPPDLGKAENSRPKRSKVG